MTDPTWTRQSLVDLCRRSDDIRCGPFGTQLKKDEFRTAGVPLWGIKHVNAKFQFTTDEFVEAATAGRLAQYDLIPGDLVMTRKGTIGNCAVYPEAFPLGIMHSDLLRLRLDLDKADPSFFVHQLHHSSDVHRQLASMSGGAVMPGINVGRLKELIVQVPSLAEQKRISGILDAADALRAKRREALSYFDTLIQSTFLDIFGDPVTNPMSWPIATVGEVCDVVSGATPRTGKPEFWGGKVPWVTPKDLSELGQKHLCDTPRKITRAGFESCSAKMLPARSVLFSSRAPIGLVAINTLPVCTNQGFKSLVPRLDVVSPDFLFWWLKTQEKRIQSKGRGATFKEISKNIVANLRIPLPPLGLQHAFAAIEESVERQKANQRAHLAELDTLFASLQSRAFRGDL